MRCLYTIHFNIGVSTRSFVTVTILYRVFSLHVSRVWYMSRVYTYMGLELISA